MNKQGFFVVLAQVGFVLLLPVLAVAHGGLSGPCVDCHTMHNSQNGGTMGDGPNPKLLRHFDCVGCHAYTTNDSANGRAGSAPSAPQVWDSVTSLAGGYFTDGGADGIQHNVDDLGLGLDGSFTNIPGTANTYDINSKVTCEKCHDSTIGHAVADSARAGDATSSYRMLGSGGQYVKGTGNVNFEAGSNGQNTYDSASLNLFCAQCHGRFHGTGPTAQGDGAGGASGTPNAWLRHPTDVSLITEYTAATYIGNDKRIPVGGDGSSTDIVMCISCHRPHGSSQADLLRFTYSDSQAGSGGESFGCETCHGEK